VVAPAGREPLRAPGLRRLVASAASLGPSIVAPDRRDPSIALSCSASRSCSAVAPFYSRVVLPRLAPRRRRNHRIPSCSHRPVQYLGVHRSSRGRAEWGGPACSGLSRGRDEARAVAERYRLPANFVLAVAPSSPGRTRAGAAGLASPPRASPPRDHRCSTPGPRLAGRRRTRRRTNARLAGAARSWLRPPADLRTLYGLARRWCILRYGKVGLR